MAQADSGDKENIMGHIVESGPLMVHQESHVTNLHVRSITLGTGCGDYFQKGRSGRRETLSGNSRGEVMGLSHSDDGRT